MESRKRLRVLTEKEGATFSLLFPDGNKGVSRDFLSQVLGVILKGAQREVCQRFRYAQYDGRARAPKLKSADEERAFQKERFSLHFAGPMSPALHLDSEGIANFQKECGKRALYEVFSLPSFLNQLIKRFGEITLDEADLRIRLCPPENLEPRTGTLVLGGTLVNAQELVFEDLFRLFSAERVILQGKLLAQKDAGAVSSLPPVVDIVLRSEPASAESLQKLLALARQSLHGRFPALSVWSFRKKLAQGERLWCWHEPLPEEESTDENSFEYLLRYADCLKAQASVFGQPANDFFDLSFHELAAEEVQEMLGRELKTVLRRIDALGLASFPIGSTISELSFGECVRTVGLLAANILSEELPLLIHDHEPFLGVQDLLEVQQFFLAEVPAVPLYFTSHGSFETTTSEKGKSHIWRVSAFEESPFRQTAAEEEAFFFRLPSPSLSVEDLVVSPKRIGIFGRSGCGKSTFLKALYNESRGRKGFFFAAHEPASSAILSSRLGELGGLLRAGARLFASCAEARRKGYTAPHFSGESRDVRCEYCRGKGVLQQKRGKDKVYLWCLHCNGSGLRADVLCISISRLSFGDYLSLSLSEALDFLHQEQGVQYEKQSSWKSFSGLPLRTPFPWLSPAQQRLFRVLYEIERAQEKEAQILFCDALFHALSQEDAARLRKDCERLGSQGVSLCCVDYDRRRESWYDRCFVLAGTSHQPSAAPI